MNQSKIIKYLLNQSPKVIETYPIIAPKGSPKEYATYNSISSLPFNSNSGFVNYQSRVQVDIYATTYVRATELAQLAINRLIGFNKVVPGVQVQEVELINVIDGFNQSSEENGNYRIIREFLIFHE